jgi:hypothetical protein
VTWVSRGRSWPLDPTAPAGRIQIANADGSDRRTLTDLPGHQSEPDFTADGRRVVFTWSPIATASETSAPTLWSVDVNGGDLQQLSVATTDAMSATFSPDGRWVAFASGMSFFTAALDGSVVYWHPVSGGRAAWSPDSRTLVLFGTRHADAVSGPMVLAVDGSAPPELIGRPPVDRNTGGVQFIGDGTGTRAPDVAGPIAVVGAQKPRVVGMSPTTVRSLSSRRRPAPVVLRGGATARLLALDRTGMRRLDASVARVGAAPRWRRIRSSKQLGRLTQRLRRGNYTLRVRARDVRGNVRTGAVELRVRG